MYQCRLACDGQETVGWIEDRAAKKGALVEMKEDGRFWLVLDVGTHMNDDAFKQHQRMHRNRPPSLG